MVRGGDADEGYRNHSTSTTRIRCNNLGGEPMRRGNPAPVKGLKPMLVPHTTNPTSLLINQLVHQRNATGKPVVHISDTQHDLTIGQVTFMAANEIVIIMRDDLGQYELVPGPERRVVKRRL